MRKLQAAQRDRAWQGYKLKRIAYKVGSCFKGCHYCGDFEWVERGGREVKFYRTGHNVHRSYVPRQVGWTYWCYDCGAMDLKAWEDAKDIGMEAIRGSTEAVRAGRKWRREQWRLLYEGPKAARQVGPDPLARIMELEARLRQLVAVKE